MTTQHEGGSGPTPEEPHDHDRGLRFDLANAARPEADAEAGRRGEPALAHSRCLRRRRPTRRSPRPPRARRRRSRRARRHLVRRAQPSPRKPPARSPPTARTASNASSETGIVRIGHPSELRLRPRGTADGVPLTLELVVVGSGGRCARRWKGAAVYVWHCDREGLDSLYSRGSRPVRTTCAACRRPTPTDEVPLHEHLPGVLCGALAARPLRGVREHRRGGRGRRARSHITACVPGRRVRVVYATDGYAQSVENLSQVSLESDNVFGDGAELQLATVTGNAD